MLDVSLDNRAEQQKIAAAEAASSQTPQPTANLTQRTPQTLQIANIHVRAHVLVGTKKTERGYASYLVVMAYGTRKQIYVTRCPLSRRVSKLRTDSGP